MDCFARRLLRFSISRTANNLETIWISWEDNNVQSCYTKYFFVILIASAVVLRKLPRYEFIQTSLGPGLLPWERGWIHTGSFIRFQSLREMPRSKSPDRIPLIRYIHIEFLAEATGNEYEVIRHRVLTTVSHSLESFALWSTVATTLEWKLPAVV